METLDQYANLGAVAVIFLFATREFFTYLKSRKNGNSHPEGGFNQQIFQELQRMNDNHLHTLTDAVNEGNKEIVRTINEGNLRIVQALGEIKGQLKQ